MEYSQLSPPPEGHVDGPLESARDTDRLSVRPSTSFRGVLWIEVVRGLRAGHLGGGLAAATWVPPLCPVAGGTLCHGPAPLPQLESEGQAVPVAEALLHLAEAFPDGVPGKDPSPARATPDSGAVPTPLPLGTPIQSTRVHLLRGPQEVRQLRQFGPRRDSWPSRSEGQSCPKREIAT